MTQAMNDRIEALKRATQVNAGHLNEALKIIAELTEWQPIETAPRDGTKIDVLNRHGERTVDVWFKNGVWWHWWIDAFDGMSEVPIDFLPFRWMLPPAAPEAVCP